MMRCSAEHRALSRCLEASHSAVEASDVGLELDAQGVHLVVQRGMSFGDDPDVPFKSFGDSVEMPARPLALFPNGCLRLLPRRERRDGGSQRACR